MKKSVKLFLVGLMCVGLLFLSFTPAMAVKRSVPVPWLCPRPRSTRHW